VLYDAGRYLVAPASSVGVLDKVNDPSQTNVLKAALVEAGIGIVATQIGDRHVIPMSDKWQVEPLGPATNAPDGPVPQRTTPPNPSPESQGADQGVDAPSPPVNPAPENPDEDPAQPQSEATGSASAEEVPSDAESGPIWAVLERVPGFKEWWDNTSQFNRDFAVALAGALVSGCCVVA